MRGAFQPGAADASYTEPAITTAEADAYIQPIGDARWLATDEVAKNAAIIRGQRYVATAYNSRWTAEWEAGADIPEAVKNAIAGAARVELTTTEEPNGMLGNVT